MSFRACTLILVLFAFASLFARATSAQTQAPTLGGCFGSGGFAADVCVGPDLSFDAVRLNLVTNQWSGGLSAVGPGYVLLFGQSRWWASGVAVHVLANLSQAAPNFIEPSASLAIFRYVHAGFAWHINGAYTQTSFLAGLSIPVDVLTTGNARARAARALAAQKATGSP